MAVESEGWEWVDSKLLLRRFRYNEEVIIQ
jgi:hypothetical protein